MSKCRAVCGNCFRTFMCDFPEDAGLCWACGENLLYILGSDDICSLGTTIKAEKDAIEERKE